MSPSGKAPDFDSGIRRFESCHPSHVGARRALLRFYFFLPDPLAQLAEQLPFKQWVWSSNLQRVTKKQPRGCFFCVPDGDSKTCNATVRWTVTRATDAGLLASKAFGNLPDCKQHCAPERDPSIFAVQKCKRTQAGHQKVRKSVDSRTFSFIFCCKKSSFLGRVFSC